MQYMISRWMNRAFLNRPSRASQRRRSYRRIAAVEALESRLMLDVTLSNIIAGDLPAGKNLYVPLEASSSDDAPITFTVHSDDPTVSAEILTGGRTLVMNVSGVDNQGNPFTGDLHLRLFEDVAPVTTARIIELAEAGFYDGVTFHRIIDDFMAQGGDPSGTGAGGSGVQFDDEFDPLVTFSSRGLLAMANSGDDTNDSQFFIVDIDLPLQFLPQHLNFNHTIFGILTSGFDTFEKVMTTPTGAQDRPLNDVVINSVDVIQDQSNGVVKLFAPVGFEGSAEITVTANDGGAPAEQTFVVDVVEDMVNDRAFLGPVTDQVTSQNVPVTFNVVGFDLEGDTLTFVVRDPNDFASPPPNVTVEITTVPAQINGAAFAQALAAAGTQFYGAEVCTACTEQKNLFGSGVFSNGNDGGLFIESLNEDGTLTDEALEAGITAFPTWIFPDGTRLIGVQSLDVLSHRAGVEIPRTETTATITVTPDEDFHGTVDMLVGVRDQVNRDATLNSRGNFDTQRITLTVNEAADRPIAFPQTIEIEVDEPVAIQLEGAPGGSDPNLVISFALVTAPLHGTISGFNQDQGTLTYTPHAGFTGVDSFMFEVIDNGGTADGRQNISEPATVTIHVGTPDDDDDNGDDNDNGVVDPQAPTNLALAPGSDTGLFNNDNFTSNSSPMITMTAQSGHTVQLTVNGNSAITATETSPGQFSATLPRELLMLGTNTVTATANDGTQTTGPSAPLNFIYAPSFDDVYTVPGEFGSVQQISFVWTSRQAAFRNELGFYVVDDVDGRIGNLRPGDPGYAQAALNHPSRQIMFSRGMGPGAQNTVTFAGGDLIAFYLIANNTTERFLSRNPQNNRRGPNAYFSFTAANPDGVEHVRAVADPISGHLVMHWEDMWNGGDRDYNDAVITVAPVGAGQANVGEAFRVLAGPTQQVPATFTLMPTQRAAGSNAGSPPAATGGEFGLFVVDDHAGTVDGIAPGNPLFTEAVLTSGSRQVIFGPGESIGSTQQLNVPGAELLGFYYIVGGTAEDVFFDNVENNPAAGPFMYFSFAAANPDGLQHFRWHSPERVTAQPLEPNNWQLHVMDRLFGGENDFNDYLINIRLGN